MVVTLGQQYTVGEKDTTLLGQQYDVREKNTRNAKIVVVFFTLTDRASTIPSNIRGCQSGTWSAGQKKIRGTSTKLQREQKKNIYKQKQKRQRDKIDEGHSIERIWHSASRKPSDTLPGSQTCTQVRSIYHIPYSQGFSFH